MTRLITRTLLAATLISFALVSAVSAGCSPEGTLEVENQTGSAQSVDLTGPCTISFKFTVADGQTVSFYLPSGSYVLSLTGGLNTPDVARGETTHLTLSP